MNNKREEEAVLVELSREDAKAVLRSLGDNATSVGTLGAEAKLRAALDTEPGEVEGGEAFFTSEDKMLLIARLARGKSKLDWRAAQESDAIDKLMALLDRFPHPAPADTGEADARLHALEGLRSAFQRLARHSPLCASMTREQNCDCGYDEALTLTNPAVVDAFAADTGDRPEGCGHPNHGAADHTCEPFLPAPDCQPPEPQRDELVERLRRRAADEAHDPGNPGPADLLTVTLARIEKLEGEAEKWKITSDAHCHMLMLVDDILRPVIGSDAGAHPDDWADAAVKRIESAEQRADRLEEALPTLTHAAQPYVENAAPGEQLFRGEDLRRFEALTAALAGARAALSPGEERG